MTEEEVVVCMVCDFYLPNLGGVEAHIHHIAVNLASQGTKVWPPWLCGVGEKKGRRRRGRGKSRSLAHSHPS